MFILLDDVHDAYTNRIEWIKLCTRCTRTSIDNASGKESLKKDDKSWNVPAWHFVIFCCLQYRSSKLYETTQRDPVPFYGLTKLCLIFQHNHREVCDERTWKLVFFFLLFIFRDYSHCIHTFIMSWMNIYIYILEKIFFLYSWPFTRTVLRI